MDILDFERTNVFSCLSKTEWRGESFVEYNTAVCTKFGIIYSAYEFVMELLLTR